MIILLKNHLKKIKNLIINYRDNNVNINGNLCIIIVLISVRNFNILIFKLKKMLNSNENIVLEPKKKIEIKLNKIEKLFLSKVNTLEKLLEKNILSDINQKIGNELLQNANHFLNSDFIGNSKIRLKNGSINLLKEDDFSIWVNNELAYLNEEISVFINVIERMNK